MSTDKSKVTPPTARTRAPRGSLTRARIVATALEIAAAEGCDAVSMPRLARDLGVATMSLYGHIESKDDLLDAILDVVLDQVAAPADATTARSGRAPRPGDVEVVLDHFRRLHRAVLDHPGIGRLFTERRTASARVFVALDAGLAVLHTAGFNRLGAVRLYYALVHYTLGAAMWQGARVGAGADPGPAGDRAAGGAAYDRAWTDVLDHLDPAVHRTMLDHADALRGVAGDDQFEAGLRALVAGAARRPRR